MPYSTLFEDLASMILIAVLIIDCCNSYSVLDLVIALEGYRALAPFQCYMESLQ